MDFHSGTWGNTNTNSAFYELNHPHPALNAPPQIKNVISFDQQDWHFLYELDFKTAQKTCTVGHGDRRKLFQLLYFMPFWGSDLQQDCQVRSASLPTSLANTRMCMAILEKEPLSSLLPVQGNSGTKEFVRMAHLVSLWKPPFPPGQAVMCIPFYMLECHRCVGKISYHTWVK